MFMALFTTVFLLVALVSTIVDGRSLLDFVYFLPVVLIGVAVDDYLEGRREKASRH